MNTVFVVQDPAKMSIDPARKFGTLRVILKGTESRDKAIWRLLDVLQHLQPGDCLLQIGNPVNIGIATHLALLFGRGRLNVLVWRRETYDYTLEEIRLDESHESAYSAALNRQ